MEYILSITFICENGEKTTLSIDGVKSSITKEEIISLMDTIIANNIFLTKHGGLVSKSGASITERVVTSYSFEA